MAENEKDKLYKSEYVGSGTFLISKPQTQTQETAAVARQEAAARRAEISAGFPP